MAERARSLAFDRVAQEYDATRGGMERGAAVAAALLPFLPSDPILEIGVGTGVVAAGLRAAGRAVLGVDLSRPMLLQAKSRVGPCLVQGDAEHLPVADGSVPSAYAVWVLHLVADVSAVLTDLARVLRPGGRCVIVSSRPLSHPDTDVDRVVTGMWQRLQPQGRPDSVERLIPKAAAAGLRLVEQTLVDGGARPVSPRELVDRIERRSFSILWEVSEDRWRADVEPLLAELRALPEQDAGRVSPVEHPVLVFER